MINRVAVTIGPSTKETSTGDDVPPKKAIPMQAKINVPDNP